MTGELIYLDHAATSWPKPPAVIQAMEHVLRKAGGNPGRSAHPLALRAAEEIDRCRLALGGLFHVAAPENIVFTMNTTYALNMAIKGLLHPGDHVLISNLEHNAVRRPLERLRVKRQVTVEHFRGNGTAGEILQELQDKARPETRAVICLQASNICGTVLPLSAIAGFCRERKWLFIVDAAQSAGRIEIDFGKLQADAMAIPGHKGLYGSQGVGVLLLREGLVPETLMEGGTGIHSLEAEMPSFLPERLEAGTLPTPAIAGLRAGVEWLRQTGIGAVAEKEAYLAARMAERLRNDGRWEVYGADVGPVLSANLRGVPAQAVGRKLGEYGVCVRSGFHCAPLAHETLQTGENGSVRFSVGFFNTEKEIKKLDRVLTLVEREFHS